MAHSKGARMNLDKGVKIAEIVFYSASTIFFVYMLVDRVIANIRMRKLLDRADQDMARMLEKFGFKEMKPPPDLQIIKEEKEPIN